MIEQKLQAWGAWVRSDSDKLGYHSNYERILALAPEHDAKDAQKRSNLPFMSDCEALSIDRAVGQLQRHSALLCAVLRLHYIFGWSMRKIARDYLTPMEYPDGGKSVRYEVSSQLLARATGVIEGCLI